MRFACRSLCSATVAAATAIAVISLTARAAEDSEEKVAPVLDHEVVTIEGEKCNLAEEFGGKVLLVVNVASRCGYTPQYKELQALNEKYADQGLAILGFPCNQFGAQEPGNEAEILSFCTEKYDVSFPMFAKVEVNGDDADGLFKTLTSKETTPDDPGPVKWNFEKFLVGRDGAVVARYRSAVKPSSEEVIEAIEEQLAKKTPESEEADK